MLQGGWRSAGRRRLRGSAGWTCIPQPHGHPAQRCVPAPAAEGRTLDVAGRVVAAARALAAALHVRRAAVAAVAQLCTRAGAAEGSRLGPPAGWRQASRHAASSRRHAYCGSGGGSCLPGCHAGPDLACRRGQPRPGTQCPQAPQRRRSRQQSCQCSSLQHARLRRAVSGSAWGGWAAASGAARGLAGCSAPAMSQPPGTAGRQTVLDGRN